MTSIWLKALRAILVALVGSLNYDRVKELVIGADHRACPGMRSAPVVVEEARNVGIAIGYALLNLAIETAVVSLRGGK